MRLSLVVHREFSVHSVLLLALFIFVFVAAVLVDLAGLLQYAGLVSGLPFTVLETGAAITAASIFPFLAMGMSISGDLNHKK